MAYLLWVTRGTRLERPSYLPPCLFPNRNPIAGAIQKPDTTHTQNTYIPLNEVLFCKCEARWYKAKNLASTFFALYQLAPTFAKISANLLHLCPDACFRPSLPKLAPTSLHTNLLHLWLDVFCFTPTCYTFAKISARKSLFPTFEASASVLGGCRECCHFFTVLSNCLPVCSRAQEVLSFSLAFH